MQCGKGTRDMLADDVAYWRMGSRARNGKKNARVNQPSRTARATHDQTLRTAAEDRVHRAGAVDGRRGAGLSHQVGTDPGSVLAGRFQRHRSPSARDPIERAAGQAVHCREQDRSRWRSRRRAGGECAEGRPHAAHRLDRDRDQSVDARAVLRHDQGLRADRSARHRPGRRGGQHRPAGQVANRSLSRWPSRSRAS